MNHLTRCIVPALALGLATNALHAQPGPNDPPESDPMQMEQPPMADPMTSDDGPIPESSSESPQGALAGPSVDSGNKTLVHRDFNGEFVRVQGRPELAALQLISADPERREKARQAGYDRLIEISMLLVDEIDLVKEATDSIRAGNQDRLRELQQKLYEQYDPEKVRDPLLPAFEQILSDEECSELKRLIDEYWEAWIDWRLRTRPNAGRELRDQICTQLKFVLFREELGQGYNLSLRPYQQRLEGIYTVTEPTDEQRAAIRETMIDFIRETRLQPTEEQRQETARAIYEILDEERRMKIFSYALWDR